MDLEVVTVGAELLAGLTVDTNAADIARALTPVGARVVRRATVGDDAAAVRAAVRDALARCGFVIVTGGLGPTRDDVTKHAVAAHFGMRIVTDAAYLAGLEERWRRLGRAGRMPEANRTQAEVPDGATVLPNPRGTAPGLWLEGEPGVAVLLPGVPREMRGLMAEEVAPRIRDRIAASGRLHPVHVRTLRTTGIAESALADALREVEDEDARVRFAYYPSLEGVDVRLVLEGMDTDREADILGAAVRRVQEVVGTYCYAEGEADLAAVVLEDLAARDARLAVAESCTGGLVGGRITDVPGSSRVFLGGVIAYDNAVKERELGVGAALLGTHGAVSEPVVQAMARGAQVRFGAEAAVAVSGIAGPGGGTPEKPVGTVFIAARLGDHERTVHVRLPGDRHDVRHRAAQAALDALRRLLATVRD